MTLGRYLLLGLLGLGMAVLVSVLEPTPGYLDASYYCATGLQLASGRGFTEPFLWNYLDDPQGLPHPSHAYWMPLASLLAAAGAALFGKESCLAARVVFVGLAACIPPLTAALSWSLSSRREHAVIAALLAVFPAFYVLYLPATDTFVPYLLFGGLFFLCVAESAGRVLKGSLRFLALGLLAGLMHLARADGLLWLAVAWAAVWLLAKERAARWRGIVATWAGYFLVMTPWFVRNWFVFGAPLGTGNSRMLWLTSYNQLFSYPANDLTLASWWASGIKSIAAARLWALRLNLQSAFGVQGEVFLFPCILAGIWHFRRDARVRLALFAWLLTLLTMTFVFPFAGARGGFLHSGAAFQALWWSLALIGLEKIVRSLARWRKWRREQEAQVIFRAGVVSLAFLLTALLIWERVLGGLDPQRAWGRDEARYAQIGDLLKTAGAQAEDVVIVADPPAFYLTTGHPSIALPEGDMTTLRKLAERYHARYLILEAGAITAGFRPLYEAPTAFQEVCYLGEMEGARVFAIQP